jgi:hypothetical protein
MGNRGRGRRRWSLVVPLVVSVACSSPGAQPLITASQLAPVSGPDHIVVIAMENREYGDIIGSSSAPYLNALARRSVLLTHEYAIRHPSLPNYLALTGGATFGIRSNCTHCSLRRRNIVDQLTAHGISWKAYMQAMPWPCFKGAFAGRGSHRYAKKHDPFLYYDDIRNRPFRCRRVVPFTQLQYDLDHGAPQFAWITPDQCFDMHSCPVRTGDRWLRTWVPRILGHLGPDGILMIVFDEGRSNARCCSLPTGGGHVMALIAGPGAKAGVRIRRAKDHYSLLRLIEDAWGLHRLAHAGDARTPTIWGWKA